MGSLTSLALKLKVMLGAVAYVATHPPFVSALKRKALRRAFRCTFKCGSTGVI